MQWSKCLASSKCSKYYSGTKFIKLVQACACHVLSYNHSHNDNTQKKNFSYWWPFRSLDSQLTAFIQIFKVSSLFCELMAVLPVVNCDLDTHNLHLGMWGGKEIICSSYIYYMVSV